MRSDEHHVDPAEEDPGTEIVPADSEAAPRQITNGGGFVNPFDSKPLYFTNLNKRNPDHAALIARSYGPDDVKGADMLNAAFGLHAVVVRPVQVTDPNSGEVATVGRTALVMADGRIMSFVSQGVNESIALIVNLMGNGPWDPPLRCRVRQVQTRLGRRWYWVDLLPAEVPEKGGRKSGK